MSRHRNVRSMNYQDEYDGYDDVYGHSVEDGDFCVSPSTAHYLSDRSNQTSLLEAFITPSKINEENEGTDDEQSEPLQESSEFQRPQLSDIDEARLNSCLEEMRNIVGDSTPEHLMVNAVLKNDFSFEKALSFILSQQEAPKPHRDQRSRTTRDPGIGLPSPRPSPPYTPDKFPLSLANMSIDPTSRNSTTHKTSQLFELSEMHRENDKNIGNVRNQVSEIYSPLKKDIASLRISAEGSKLIHPNLSLASLAQTYCESPIQLSNISKPESKPPPPPGLSLSMMAQQQTAKPNFASKAESKTNPVDVHTGPRISLAKMALQQSSQSEESPKFCLKSNDLSGLAGSFLESDEGNKFQCPELSLASLAKNQHSTYFQGHGTSFLGDISQFSKVTTTKYGAALDLNTTMSSLAQVGSSGLCKEANVSEVKQSVPNLSSLSSLIMQQSESTPNPQPYTLQVGSSIKAPVSTESVHHRVQPKSGLSLSALAQIHNETTLPIYPSKNQVNETKPAIRIPPGFSGHVPRPSQHTKTPQNSTVGCSDVSLVDFAQHQTSYDLNRDASKMNVEQILKPVSGKPASRGILTTHAAYPSMFGQVMCCRTNADYLFHKLNINRPQSIYKQQTSYNTAKSDHRVKCLVPFDFSTPSPDDVIKCKQRGAFARPGERAEYSPLGQSPNK